MTEFLFGAFPYAAVLLAVGAGAGGTRRGFASAVSAGRDETRVQPKQADSEHD